MYKVLPRCFVLVVLTSSFASISFAQSVTESWLRQAGITCGGGLSVELQGEIDAALLRGFKLANIEGDGRFQQSETEALLEQFQKDEKRPVYRDYIDCLKAMMNIATGASTLPPQDVVLDSAIAVASLETIKRGQRFVMTNGDTVALNDHSLIFTVDKVTTARDLRYVYFTWSNSESGTSDSSYVTQSKLIIFSEGCSVTPYQINVQDSQVSFRSNC